MMKTIYRNDSDPLENNIRRSVREWEEAAPAEWDTPPPALWDKIAAAAPPPAATGIIWWKWLSGALLVLGLTAGSLWWLNSSSTPEKQTPAAVQTPLMAEQTEQPSLPETPASTPVPQADQEQVAHISNSAASAKPPQSSRRKPIPAVSKTGKASANELNGNASAAANTGLSDASGLGGTEQTSVEGSYLLPALSETPVLPETPATAENQSTTAPLLTSWSPVEALASPLPALLPTSGQPVAMAAVSLAKRAPKSGHFYAGVMMAPNRTFRQIQSDRPRAQLPAFLRENESASWTTEYGVRVGWQPNRRIALSVGAGQYNVSQQSRYRFRIPFDPVRERPTTNNNFESNYNLSVPSSYGDANVEVGVQRPGNQPLLPGQFLNVETRTQTNLRYISLPLTATYFLHSSPRWSVGVKGGVALSVLDKQDFTATSTISLRGLRSRTITVQRQAPDIEKTMADYQLGAALWYRPAPGWTVSMEPTFRHSIGTVLERGDYSVSQYAWGVQLGMQKSF
jgi:hypothetical protein